jgi:hypothetical protein
MNTRTIWIAAGAVIYTLIVCGHAAVLYVEGAWAQTAPLFQIVYGAFYFTLEIALLGAVARAWPGAGTWLWRPVTLATATLLGVLEAWLLAAVFRVSLQRQVWATALLGVALAAMLPRLVPQAWLRRWLAQDRRRGAS